MDWTGFEKDGFVKDGFVKHGFVKHGFVKHRFVKCIRKSILRPVYCPSIALYKII